MFSPKPIYLPHLPASIRLLLASVEPEEGEPLHLAERRTIRLLIATLLGQAGEGEYAHHPNGVPYLPPQGVPMAPTSLSSPYLSLSHAKQIAIVALSTETPIGIDIERMGDRVARVAPRFLLSNEANRLASSSHRLRDLHLLWSAKEAAYKLLSALSLLPTSAYPLGTNGSERREAMASLRLSPPVSLLEISSSNLPSQEEEGWFELIHLPTKLQLRVDFRTSPSEVLTLCRLMG